MLSDEGELRRLMSEDYALGNASGPGPRAPARDRRAAMGARVAHGGALLFLAVFLFVPLVAVFGEALRNGVGAYAAAITQPEALQRDQAHPADGGIAVPLNLIFGLAASWALTRFEFRGKNLLMTLIDLPFAVSPVIAGMIFVLLFGAQGWFGAVARARMISRSSSRCRESSSPRRSSLFRSSRAS